MPASGPVSSRGEKSQAMPSASNKHSLISQQSMPLTRCRSIAEPLKTLRSSTKEESSLIKPQKIISEISSSGDICEENVEEFKESRKSVSSVFKERLANWRKQISKKMVFADQLDMRDPQMVSEFASDIYANMRKEEKEHVVKHDYLQTVQVSTEVKDTSRAFLVEWIIDVHRKFRLLPETLYVTVFLIDRYLSEKQIKKSQLHILGVTSLLISTKYEEIYPPELKDLLSVSENKFTRDQVLAMEMDMLLTLQFQVTSPSAYRFLERFRKLSTVANDDKVFFFA